MTNLTLMDTYKEVEERKADIPSPYRSFGPVVGTASHSIQPETNLRSSAFNFSPLMGLRFDHKYTLARPLLVKVVREDDTFFAENETLSLFGVGSTSEEAISDLVDDVRYFYNYYKSKNESDLIGNGLKLKKIYDCLFIET